MWPSAASPREHNISHLLGEILVRVVLVMVVCTMAFTVHPRIRCITHDQLLTDYKRPRRQSYIPLWVMVCLIIFIPLIIFALPWLLTKNYIDTTQAILAWTLALSITAMITEVIKLSVGRPRPDFFYRCYPNGKITKDLHCVGDVREIMEGRKSFPSGHSSFAFASLGFLSLWIYGKLKLKWRGNVARVFCCVPPMLTATIIAASRVYDNHHHWEDVLAGSVIGSVSSYFCYSYYYNALDSELAGTPYPLAESESDSSDMFSTVLSIAPSSLLQCIPKSAPARLETKPGSRKNSSETIHFV
ncbi:phospholipid phosphatase 5-like [Choristoneura fumiferana]|uniref:phospholipid phosphatase 5-like n=1 Tax=Choristoneura fumiferana TaxID=7141 RepID=UPI003D15AEE6